MTPNHQTLIQKAVKLHMSGKLSDATEIYLQVMQQDPDNFDALHLSGAAALQSGNAEGAVQLIQQALTRGKLTGDKKQHRGRLGDAHNNLALAFQKLRQFDEALVAARDAQKYRPNDADVLANLGLILKVLGQYEEAELRLRRSLSLNPKQVKALIGLSLILYITGRRVESEQQARAALELEPNNPAAYNLRAALEVARGDPEAALRSFDRALSADVNNHDAWFNKSQLLLGLGRFKEAWQIYYRHHPGRRAVTQHHEPFPELMNGQRVCVIRNQGIGDELFFLRFVALLKRRGAYVIYRTEPRMMGFATRLNFIDEVISTGPTGPIKADYAVLMDYLPSLLQLGDSDTPPSMRLLALSGALRRMALRLQEAGPPPYLGVTWRAGRMRSEVDFKNELTEVLFKETPIEQLAEALRQWSGTVLILQRNPAADEMTRFQQALGRPAIDCSDVNENLEDMLALLSLIERYVAVSNTNLHLREAAGLPSHVLVPNPPEWRWGFGPGRSPWFPDCPVYRQLPNGSWQEALTKLDNELLL